MEILLENRQKIIPIKPAALLKIVQKILRHLKIRRASLSFVFVTDGMIRQFNKKYLGRDHITDVLAFDLRPSKNAGTLEGDIVISAPAARRNAKIYKTSPRRELVLYMAHGILHLLGYDDHKPKDIKKMRAKEEELMTLVRPLISAR